MLPLLPDNRVRQRDYLLEIARALTEQLNLDKLLSQILKISIEMLVGQAGLIALNEPPDGWKILVSQDIPDVLLRYLHKWIERIPEGNEPTNAKIPKRSTVFYRISVWVCSAGLACRW